MKVNFRTHFVLAMVAMLASTVTQAVHASDQNGEVELLRNRQLEVPVDALLVAAHGFDDNDNVQVVLHGMLPNGCYTLANARAERGSGANRIRVRQFAILDQSGVCASTASMPDHMKTAVPFTNELSLGVLAMGDYQFEYRTEKSPLELADIHIMAALTPSVDSLPYAATTSMMTTDIVNGREDLKVNIAGMLNSTCLELDENIAVQREGDVYVLLPITRLNTHVVCTQVLRPFARTINLGKAPKPGHYLVQVRSMNGRAVNHVVQVMR